MGRAAAAPLDRLPGGAARRTAADGVGRTDLSARPLPDTRRGEPDGSDPGGDEAGRKLGGSWWLVVGGWWLVVGGWWLVVVVIEEATFRWACPRHTRSKHRSPRAPPRLTCAPVSQRRSHPPHTSSACQAHTARRCSSARWRERRLRHNGRRVTQAPA